MANELDKQTQADLESLATKDVATDVEEIPAVQTALADELIGEEPEPETDEPKETPAKETPVEDEPKPEEAEAEPEETAAEEEPKMVRLEALQDERGRRQELQRQLKEYQETGKAAPVVPVTPPSQPVFGSTDTSDPDPDTQITDEDYDVMLPSDRRKHDRARDDWRQRETGRVNRLNADQHYQQVDARGKQRFTTETQGENLDYNTVLRTGSGFLTEADANAINASVDPEGLAYKLCVERCPALAAQQKARSAKSPVTPSPEPEPEKPPVENTPPPSIESVVKDAADRTPATTAAELEY